jgi:hypothetical protein
MPEYFAARQPTTKGMKPRISQRGQPQPKIRQMNRRQQRQQRDDYESVSLFPLFSPVHNIFVTPFGLRPASTVKSLPRMAQTGKAATKQIWNRSKRRKRSEKESRENLLRNARFFPVVVRISRIRRIHFPSVKSVKSVVKNLSETARMGAIAVQTQTPQRILT